MKYHRNRKKPEESRFSPPTSTQVRRIYIDTCALVEFDAFLTFMEIHKKSLESGKLCFCVPRKVVYEIVSILNNPSKSLSTKRSAFCALLLLQTLCKKSMIEFFGMTDRIADAVFLEHAVSQFCDEPLCILTNDHTLAQDLLSFKHLSTCPVRNLELCELCSDGTIRKYRDTEDFVTGFQKKEDEL